MHLRQPEFIYSAYGLFTKSKQRNINIKKQGSHEIFIKKDQISLAFNMIWIMYFKDLSRRTTFNKVLHDKAFNIALRIQNIMNIKEFLLRWFTIIC